MDIISHAVAGAATGSAFGKPILGAILAIIPDLPLFFRERLKFPSVAYLYTHSLLFPLVIILILSMFSISTSIIWLIWFCWTSHVLLDLCTHGGTWTPRLFYPCNLIFVETLEWEFFNSSWKRGLIVTISWSVLWLSL